MQLLLLVYTWVGGSVLDLCCGTLKVGMAALLTGRRCIAADKDAKVVALGINRAKLYYTYLKKGHVLPKLGEEQRLVTENDKHAVERWMQYLPVELQPKGSAAFWQVCVCLIVTCV
jgi:hypothetical protein